MVVGGWWVRVLEEGTMREGGHETMWLTMFRSMVEQGMAQLSYKLVLRNTHLKPTSQAAIAIEQVRYPWPYGTCQINGAGWSELRDYPT